MNRQFTISSQIPDNLLRNRGAIKTAGQPNVVRSADSLSARCIWLILRLGYWLSALLTDSFDRTPATA